MRILILLLSFCLASCATTQNFVEKTAITKSQLSFPEIVKNDTNSQFNIDHSAFDEFLEAYLMPTSQDGHALGAALIRYGAVTDVDRKALSAYVNRLQSVKVTSLNRDEQLYFWINLYNAETIRVILENYPVKSIRSIKSSPLDFKGPWNDARLNVEGLTLTLDDIENKIVRPAFDDPRIHYALNCAAIGCPNLRLVAYTGEGLDDMLDTQARAFINNPRGVKVEDGTVTVSRIFLWYKSDYGQSEADILHHIRKFADPGLKKSLEGRTKIDRYEYDWALNDADVMKK